MHVKELVMSGVLTLVIVEIIDEIANGLKELSKVNFIMKLVESLGLNCL